MNKLEAINKIIKDFKNAEVVSSTTDSAKLKKEVLVILNTTKNKIDYNIKYCNKAYHTKRKDSAKQYYLDNKEAISIKNKIAYAKRKAV